MNVFTRQRLNSSLIILLIILNILLLSTFWVQQFRRAPSKGPQEPTNKTSVPKFLVQELELNPKQTQHFEALRQKFFQESKMINADIQTLKEAIMQELFVDTPDSSRITMLAEEIGAKQAELEKRRFQHLWELKTSCSSEQLVKFQGIFRELFPVPPDVSPKGSVPLKLTPILELTDSPNEEKKEPEAPAENPNICQERLQGESCQFTDSQGITKGSCLPVGPGPDLLCVPKEENTDNSPKIDEFDDLQDEPPSPLKET